MQMLQSFLENAQTMYGRKVIIHGLRTAPRTRRPLSQYVTSYLNCYILAKLKLMTLIHGSGCALAARSVRT